MMFVRFKRRISAEEGRLVGAVADGVIWRRWRIGDSRDRWRANEKAVEGKSRWTTLKGVFSEQGSRKVSAFLFTRHFVNI